jgi:16S rRNA (cytidine1402-2'-O)-methyltransferase
MPGILYVVATPIGNLEDITLRALRILRDVSVIAAEDTRRTARLLQQYSISTPTTSLHEHNERQRSVQLVARLEAGNSVALVSDAGTPVVSDPGLKLVQAARAAGIRVEPVPGPSAALAALSASGVPAETFLFMGFPPAKAGARRRWLEELADEARPIILYESPHRVTDLLGDMAELWPGRRIAVGRELTKLHEELVEGPISELRDHFLEPRGEFTVILQPAEAAASGSDEPEPGAIFEEFRALTEAEGLSTREAVKRIARRRGLGARAVYETVHRSKDGGQSTKSSEQS